MIFWCGKMTSLSCKIVFLNPELGDAIKTSSKVEI